MLELKSMAGMTTTEPRPQKPANPTVAKTIVWMGTGLVLRVEKETSLTIGVRWVLRLGEDSACYEQMQKRSV